MVISRRVLVATTALAPAIGWAAPAASASPAQPPIRPRSAWGANLPPVGPLQDEPDVRFLLVHHTQTPNTDAGARVRDRLRTIYGFHTGERGWPDVAYNFFVDGEGVIWEGRQGSIDRPVKGDATGGSQGHALLCCFVGDFTTQPPTPAAMESMAALLAWLAGREGLDLAGPVTFTSRGSTKWRRGAQVNTEQVAAHRDMSATECPGDALYPLVAAHLLPRARALLVGPPPTPAPTPTPSDSAPAPGPSSPPTEGHPGSVPPDEGTLRAVGGGAVVAGLLGVLISDRVGRRAGGGRASAAEVADGQGDAADDQRREQPDQEAPQRG